MNRFVFGICLLSSAVLFATPRGRTGFDAQTGLIATERTADEDFVPPVEARTEHKTSDLFTSTIDSMSMNIVLMPGEFYAVYVDVPAGTLGFALQESPLDSALEWWVSRAPASLQTQLRLNLADIDPIYATIYAPMLADADPLWLDELFFCLANLAPQILELPEMSYLLPENVSEMYRHDSLLHYVEIIDLGTPGTPAHSTIARYFTSDTGMTAVDTVTIDAEMFYRYVMFPKVTDEIPLFIEPNTGDPVDPWSGRFWRTWFWDVSETAIVGSDTFFCWALSDSLMAQDVLWNGIRNTDADNGAVGIITKWIRSVLRFTSDSERPVQPVRIYRKHIGRCGEHEDITTAAARMALIPTRNINAISSDHVWNEFWTGWRWAGWEPVNNYVDNQWAYADGWGKQFATVFEHRGDGLFIPLTDRYSRTLSNVNMTVHDAAGRPIDGAKILVASQEGTSIFYDCILFTDSRGSAIGLTGAGKHLYWRVDSEIGSNPAPGYVDNLVTLTADGMTYDRNMNLAATMPHHSWTPAPPLASPTAFLGARIAPVEEYIRHEGPFDGMTTHYYFKKDDAFGFALFVLDDEQFGNFASGSAFSALGMLERIGDGGFEVALDDRAYWLVVSNKENIVNTMVCDLAVALRDSSTYIEDAAILPEALTISAYPNPFNSAVSITAPADAEIEIFDVNGRCVACLGSARQPAGTVGSRRASTALDKTTSDACIAPTTREHIWSPPADLASGVYLLRAKANEDSVVKRIVYLK